MLNGPSSMNGSFAMSVLRMPTSGPISIIQPMVVAKPGNMNATQNMYSTP